MEAKLTSWNDTPTRREIEEFVAAVSEAGGPHHVPPEERVAVFDNDGTLWCEKPLPIQADFLFRRLGEMAEKDPTLRDRQPWKAVVDKEFGWLSGAITNHYKGDDSDLKVMAGGLLQAYAGTTIEDFAEKAEAFFQSGQHPTLRRPYVECTYLPMVELLRYLEAHGFTNYIASGGGRDFVRVVSQEVYGIPPERVIGSTVGLEFREGELACDVVHMAELDLFDDGPAKPLAIWNRAGRRPLFAAGNSNGDLQMLRFAEDASHPTLRVLLLHDDGGREFDYVAGAEQAIERAKADGWTLVSIKDDWARVFAA